MFLNPIHLLQQHSEKVCRFLWKGQHAILWKSKTGGQTAVTFYSMDQFSKFQHGIQGKWKRVVFE